MALTHIPLEQVTEADLQRLIEAATAESLYIEYKRVTYGGKDEDHKEFLADISSFANSAGGDLVIGMAEDHGKPTAFEPFFGNVDAERMRLDQMARGGIEPPLSNLQTAAVPLMQGGHVIILRVPRSYNPPHRVAYKGTRRFFARSSASARRYEPNVEELRSLFVVAPQLSERIRAFKMERIAKIVARETPVPLVAENGLLVLHVIPYSAFDLRGSLSLAEVERHWRAFPPLGRKESQYPRLNFDGFLGVSNVNEDAAEQHAYVQVFRSGAVESVRTWNPHRTIETEAHLVRYARLYAHGLHLCGVQPPLVVLASLLNVRGMKFVIGNASRLWPDTPIPADRDQYHFIESVLEAVPTDDQQTASVLRPMLDHIAGLAGKAATPTFDESGNYKLTI